MVVVRSWARFKSWRVRAPAAPLRVGGSKRERAAAVFDIPRPPDLVHEALLLLAEQLGHLGVHILEERAHLGGGCALGGFNR